MMLDKHAEEPLHTPQQSAMDHEWSMLRAILPDKTQIKTLRKIEIELNRAQLPRSADRVLDKEIDLGAIERAVGFVDLVWNAGSFQCVFQSGFRDVPVFLTPDALRGAS